MARITVEDCLEKINNPFELVLAASKRARQLEQGSAEPSIPAEGDKHTVIALREIAAGNVDESILKPKVSVPMDAFVDTEIEEVTVETDTTVSNESEGEREGETGAVDA